MKKLLVGFAVLLFACADVAPSPTEGGGDASAAASNARPRPTASTSTLVVHYPTGWGHQISVRGAASSGLTWTAGRGARWTADDAWVLELSISAPVELKPLYDDVTWSKGPNYVLAPGQTLHVYPHFFAERGRLDRMKGVRSQHVATRDVVVYLPPSYDENWRARYPVVYMHDGQNLYDDASAFGGVSWDVAGAMDRGVADATVREAIIVGIDNTADRMWEYTPTEGGHGGGGADDYLAFIADELKPAIDRDYRTLPGSGDTALIGSSLGGLVSAWGGVSRGDVFGLIGAVSPSTWWDGTWIIGKVREAPGVPLRVYVDSGDSGTSNDDNANTAKLAQAYRDRGATLKHVVQHGASHNEYWWRQRLPGALAFLLGGR